MRVMFGGKNLFHSSRFDVVCVERRVSGARAVHIGAWLERCPRYRCVSSTLRRIHCGRENTRPENPNLINACSSILHSLLQTYLWSKLCPQVQVVARKL